MPPRRKSAPERRVYKSATPLRQTTLGKPKKRIKSYGKHATRRAKDDSTLTQIGFVKFKERPEEYEEEQQQEEDKDQVDSDYEEASKKRKTKRRKTTGDRPSATPQWHTQTLTQFSRSFSANEDVEEEGEGEPPQERSIFDVPSSSPRLPRPARRVARPFKGGIHRGEESPVLDDTREGSPILDMSPPQTPRRVMRQEIPSSQSPATPFSIPSQKSSRQRFPLKDKSINTSIPFNPDPKPQPVAQNPPKLKIEDTFESGNTISQIGDVPSSPNKRPSPAKNVRFSLPEEVEDTDVPATPSFKKESTPYPSQTPSQQQVKFEILDSDEEDGEDFEEVEQQSNSQLDSTAGVPQENHEESETAYGDFGHETQFEADRIISSLAETTPNSTVVDQGDEGETVSGDTQIGQTQRVSTQHVTSMPPRTETSDIFISIHPQYVTNIVNRTKNYEMRNWAFPPSVRRIWIYETKPVSILKYMAEISSAKKPGDILDQNGLGNADFNARPRNSSWNAYEILKLYELADPVPLSGIISNGWVKAAPQRFAWVRPAVADELIANLKPPLFTDSNQDVPSSSSTDTQEVEEQLLSTISQFTQAAVPSQLASSQPVKVEPMGPPSSMHQETPRKASSPPHPSQAETVDLTQAQLPQHPSQDEDEEIIWESPARPIPSSTPLKLPTPRSTRSDRYGSDSIVAYSMSSSQFLTRSQLLPESLLNEDVPGPPRFVHDSESEDDEL